MSFKYIVIQRGNQEFPIIFPDTLVHQTMFFGVRAGMVAEASLMLPTGMNKEKAQAGMLDAIQAVSAGELNFDLGFVGGFSETLGLASRGDEDKRLIVTWPYTKGVIL